MSEEERCKILLGLVKYNKKDGVLEWLHRSTETRENKIFNTKFAGKRILTKTQQGYIVINFSHNSKVHKQVAHRFIWYVIYGELPEGIIDHIDGNTLNNKVENLRDVTHAHNMRNLSLRTSNKCGCTGISLYTRQNGNQAYVVKWTDLLGIRRSKYFSINNYGSREALELACIYRMSKIEELNNQGAGYTERHYKTSLGE